MADYEELCVSVNRLSHHFGEAETRKQVLFENSLAVARGEIVIMTGPSGSGKTTLLTLLGTLRTVQQGSVLVLGEELLDANQQKIYALRKRLGFIFQAHNLFASLTAKQNVSMAAKLAGMSRQDADRKISALLDRLGLADRQDYRPDSLSGGQKQRVAIARALIHRPQLILADEPTAALDETSGREVVNLFQELTEQQGCTVIMVTHDNRILDVADRIVSMVDGRIKSNVLVHETAIICEFLSKVSPFDSLTPQTLTEVADRMGVHEAKHSETIVRQGDAGDRFYLIRSGEVGVQIEREGQRTQVATLHEGDYFGETALMTNEPRNASVLALADSTFYTLDKDEFRRVLQKSDSFQQELRKAIFQRQ